MKLLRYLSYNKVKKTAPLLSQKLTLMEGQKAVILIIYLSMHILTKDLLT